MIRNSLSFLLITLFSITAAHGKERVDSYWIWAGIPASEIRAERIVYIYQGAFRVDKNALQFTRKGFYPSPIKAREIYLTYRINGSLPDTTAMAEIINNFAKNWEKHDVRITGIQLDFDSASEKLLQYGDFLKNFRQKLPQQYKLSITGLSDWAINGDLQALKAIAATTDEIIFQLYQGRRVLTDIEVYIDKLATLPINFKAGFLANSDYEKYIARLKHNAYFKGAVLFIQK